MGLAILAVWALTPNAYAHVDAPTLPEPAAQTGTPETHAHPRHDADVPSGAAHLHTETPNHGDHGGAVGVGHDHGPAATAPGTAHEPADGEAGGHAGMGGHGTAQPHGPSMHHPGLPFYWILSILLVCAAIFGWAIGAPVPREREPKSANLAALPLVGGVVRFLNSSPLPLFAFKCVTVTAFVLVVIAGMFGTVYPERNLTTVLVWTWWWPLVVVAVLFVGSAWCAICPWDAIASWLVRRRLWGRAQPHPGLNLRVPKWMRNVWPALLMFMGLTWLELGIGVTSSPKATAGMALLMLALSTVFLLIFERKAFCRYACPVGRTLGFYARLSPIAVRPREQETCATCTTMECYHGSATVEPCPTNLTVGKFSQNTYCLSCGNCVLSCPYHNVSWRLRSMGSEAMIDARPHWDSAWFMLMMLGITTFHGVTMLPQWTDLVIGIARMLGETGRLIASFTLGMVGGFAAPILVYALAIGATLLAAGKEAGFRRLFAALAFCALPLAFTYHLAHNLDHLFREGGSVTALFFNPLGTGLEPMTVAERHAQMMNSPVPPDVLFGLQAALMILGVSLAVHILRHRGRHVLPHHQSLSGWRLTPMLTFIGLIAGGNLWLLSQDMVMRF